MKIIEITEQLALQETVGERQEAYKNVFEKVNVSCGAYNKFRVELCKVAYSENDLDLVLSNPDMFEGKPLYNLIEKGSLEDEISEEERVELLNDLTRFEARARTIMSERYFEVYLWLKESIK